MAASTIAVVDRKVVNTMQSKLFGVFFFILAISWQSELFHILLTEKLSINL